jgi:hypothetical protein
MQTGRPANAKPSTTNRSRVTNDPRYLPGLDGRSSGARRRRDLINGFITALGGASEISPLKLAEVRRAAELVVLAEETRAQVFRDSGSVDMLALVRLKGMASRAQRSLGLKPTPVQPWSPLRARLEANAPAGAKTQQGADEKRTHATTARHDEASK